MRAFWQTLWLGWRWFDRRRGGDWFPLVVLLAALTLLCFLVYVLVAGVFFGEPAEVQIVPYGWNAPTATVPLPTAPAGLPTVVTPAPTQPPAVSPMLPVTAVPTLSDGQGGGEVCALTVRLQTVNVYVGPDEASQVVGALTGGQIVVADGWQTGTDGYTWWRLGGGGWARGDAFVDALNPNLPDPCWLLPQAGSVQVSAPETPTFTATLPLASGSACLLTVRWTQANVRQGPGTSFAIVGTLSQGQTVQAVGWATGADGFTWWQLATGGWARGDIFLDAASPQVPAECLALPATG
ncbi:MAG: hypothetical protein Kow00106_25690 [Anaerolineae bacterium]